MPYAITNTENENAEIVFKKLTSDKNFNLVSTSVVLKTNFNNVLDNDSKTIKVEGIIEDTETLLVVNNKNETKKIQIENMKFLNEDSIYTKNRVKTIYGVSEQSIVTPAIKTKLMSVKFNYTEKPVTIGSNLAYLDMYYKYLYIIDLDGNIVKRIYLYEEFNFVYNIFEDKDFVYMTSSQKRTEFIRIRKTELIDKENISEIDYDFIGFDNSEVSEDFKLASYYKNDFVRYDNYIVMTLVSDGIYIYDMELKTITKISNNINYIKNTTYSLEVVDNKLYVIGTNKSFTIYRIDFLGSDYELVNYLTHNYYLTYYFKNTIVINDIVIFLSSRVYFDIKNKKSGTLDYTFPYLTTFRTKPVIIGDKLYSAYYSNFYIVDLDKSLIENYGQTIVTLTDNIDYKVKSVTTDLRLGYYINDIDVTDNLVNISSIPENNIVTYNYMKKLENSVNEIEQKLIIGKNRVSADKFITHCYSV